MSGDTKRLNLVLPADLLDEVKEWTRKESCSSTEIIRRFIKLGLFVIEKQDDPNSSLVIREGDKEKSLLIL